MCSWTHITHLWCWEVILFLLRLCLFRLSCVFSPGDLLQVVLVSAGVFAILDLFLPPLQNGSVGLCVCWVREAGVAATEGGSGRTWESQEDRDQTGALLLTIKKAPCGAFSPPTCFYLVHEEAQPPACPWQFYTVPLHRNMQIKRQAHKMDVFPPNSLG